MSHNFVREIHLTPPQRRVLFIAQLAILSGYLITNRLMSHFGGGVTFDIWLDRYIPLWPIWVIPYGLAIVWWGVAILWAYLSMEDTLYTAFIAAWLIVCMIGYSVFIFCPNYMIRPEVTETGWAVWLIRFVYTNDRTYNAFPSQHLWSTVLIALFWSHWKPGWRWVLWASTVIVALSTLFTRQHWILDVFGGTLLAVIGYFIGLAFVARLTPVRRRRPRRTSQAGN